MSYIDCWKHEEIGTLFDIDVYHAHEDITGDDFQCKAGDLLLGGGGGEHEAIVIRDLSQLIKAYAYFKLENYSNYSYGTDWVDAIDFQNWGWQTYVSFDSRVHKYGYNNSEGYPELWVALKIAKLVVVNKPALIPDQCRNLLVQ